MTAATQPSWSATTSTSTAARSRVSKTGERGQTTTLLTPVFPPLPPLSPSTCRTRLTPSRSKRHTLPPPHAIMGHRIPNLHPATEIRPRPQPPSRLARPRRNWLLHLGRRDSLLGLSPTGRDLEVHRRRLRRRLLGQRRPAGPRRRRAGQHRQSHRRRVGPEP